MDAFQRYVTLLIGIATIIGLLVKISYTLGSTNRQFLDHVELSQKIHADQETRLRTMEQQRRQGRWLWNSPPGLTR